MDTKDNWKLIISPECPATLRDRISFISKPCNVDPCLAHLVISNVKINDGGTYGCSLNLAEGSPLVDKANLVVTGKYSVIYTCNYVQPIQSQVRGSLIQ